MVQEYQPVETLQPNPAYRATLLFLVWNCLYFQTLWQNAIMSYVVIFRSTRKLDDGKLYSEWSEKMENLVKTIDGYERFVLRGILSSRL